MSIILNLFAAVVVSTLAFNDAFVEARAPLSAKTREDAKVVYKGRDFGFSGYANVPVDGSSTKMNHIFWWYQPPLETAAAGADFPLLIWLQGVSPTTAHARTGQETESSNIQCTKLRDRAPEGRERSGPCAKLATGM